MAGSFLGKLAPDLVDELLAEGEHTDDRAGTTISREGAAPRAVLVLQGLLRVYLTSAAGRQVTARDADVLGIAVLVGGPVNGAVQALAPSSLFRINPGPPASSTPGRPGGRGAGRGAEPAAGRHLQQTAIHALVRCGISAPRPPGNLQGQGGGSGQPQHAQAAAGSGRPRCPGMIGTDSPAGDAPASSMACRQPGRPGRRGGRAARGQRRARTRPVS